MKLSTQYTIIASRFEDLSSPHDESFTLILYSNIPVSVSQLPSEWAGKSRKQIFSSWDGGENVKQFILSTARLTQFSVRLSVINSQPFVRLSLRTYNDTDGAEGIGNTGEELCDSGEGYVDLSLGNVCAIEGFDLVGGEEYVLCVERLDGDDDDGEFVLEFLADGEIEPIEI